LNYRVNKLCFPSFWTGNSLFYPASSLYILKRNRELINQEVNIMTTAYCVKCRGKVDIKNEQKITMKNGKPATKGECPKCGTKVFRIGG